MKNNADFQYKRNLSLGLALMTICLLLVGAVAYFGYMASRWPKVLGGWAYAGGILCIFLFVFPFYSALVCIGGRKAKDI